ncbi:J domain-containing protein [Nesterenkonia massiliensis]|uniref:J domain-containing protein n=1 Tax=Nesterenkonia massiliensis TaxID=1232429 RepID=UPI00041020F2|nr:DnaJ domain-containing protein [Nesterenkonia massiliensis]
MSEPDFYAVLQVAPQADAQSLRAAYRRRARQTHPDQGGSAEEFHQVQLAWETLGTPEKRAAYDRSREIPQETDDDAGASGIYSRSFTASTSGAASARGQNGTDSRRRGTSRSPQADQPPRYEPPLSNPEPLSLTLTSQKVHGEFVARGLFGSRSQRVQQRTAALLEKHVLGQLPAARLFNDVLLDPVETDRRGRRRTPRGDQRAEHVVACGQTLVLVASFEVPADAVSWDGRALRARGRTIPLPNLSAAVRRLRGTLQETARAAGDAPALQTHTQVILHSPDGDLFHPVVESRGVASGAAPLPAGRALSLIAETLAASAQANLVDRHLMTALRDQLATPDVD